MRQTIKRSFTIKDVAETPSNLAVESFGQRFQVTPIQMITMVSAIVDDGNLKTPHMVRQILNSDGSVRKPFAEIKRQVISAETSAFMREAMEAVVSRARVRTPMSRGTVWAARPQPRKF